MGRMTKTLLIVSLAGLIAGLAFVTGLVNVQTAVWLYVALPAGAICFGLFLIAKLLEQETAQYDAEQRILHAAAARLSACKASSSQECRCGRADAREASLVSAH
jgi:hypothetical protein